MPEEMPRFTMPRSASGEQAGPAAQAADSDSATELVLEPSPAADAAIERPPFGWRQLVIVGIVCVLVGAAVPFAVQSAQRAAAAAKSDGLRSATMEYLSAIALGDWEQATALVATSDTAEVAPAAVLDSAERIEDPEVVLAHVDGENGVVQVRYRVGSSAVSMLLDAAHTDGGWQLTTSLAELPRIANYDDVSVPAIAGVPLGRPAPLLLYPGSYALDTVQNPIYQYGGDGFVIDGDPGTVTEVGTALRTSQALLDQAELRATLHASDCHSTGACDWPASAAIGLYGESFPSQRMGSSGLIVQVPLEAESGAFNEHVVVTVELTVDDDGTVLEATCAGLAGFSDEPIACEA